MPLSVRHCKASPSGKRIGTFCKDTNKANIVSRRGRRDLKQSGQRNFVSFAICAKADGVIPLCCFFKLPDFDKGTQFTKKKKH